LKNLNYKSNRLLKQEGKGIDEKITTTPFFIPPAKEVIIKK